MQSNFFLLPEEFLLQASREKATFRRLKRTIPLVLACSNVRVCAHVSGRNYCEQWIFFIFIFHTFLGWRLGVAGPLFNGRGNTEIYIVIRLTFSCNPVLADKCFSNLSMRLTILFMKPEEKGLWVTVILEKKKLWRIMSFNDVNELWIGAEIEMHRLKYAFHLIKAIKMGRFGAINIPPAALLFVCLSCT